MPFPEEVLHARNGAAQDVPALAEPAERGQELGLHHVDLHVVDVLRTVLFPHRFAHFSDQRLRVGRVLRRGQGLEQLQQRDDAFVAAGETPAQEGDGAPQQGDGLVDPALAIRQYAAVLPYQAVSNRAWWHPAAPGRAPAAPAPARSPLG